VKRREALAGIAALAFASRVAAQTPALKRVAYAVPGSPDPANKGIAAFKGRLAELGWVEGRTIEYVFGYDYGESSRHEKQVADLLAQKPAVLLAVFASMAMVAKKQTSDVPIVFAISSNPEKFGLVATLARPGGNVTGVSTRELELLGKRVELLHELVPRLQRVAVLTNPLSPEISKLYITGYAAQAAKLGIKLIVSEARSAAEIGPAFDRMAREGAQGVLNVADPLHLQSREELARHAARLRLPAVYVIDEFVEAGGLLSFGTDRLEQLRRAAGHVDKILRGANPAMLPVEEPTRFVLALNLKAAKAQGIAIPQSILLRADRVIE